MDIIHSGYVLGPESLTSRVGILRDSDIFGMAGSGVTGREISGLRFSGSGVGSRDGAFDAVYDLVTARLLPRLGVLGGGFRVFGKSPGNGLLLDPLLIYRLISMGGLIAICVRLVTKKSI